MPAQEVLVPSPRLGVILVFIFKDTVPWIVQWNGVFREHRNGRGRGKEEGSRDARVMHRECGLNKKSDGERMISMGSMLETASSRGL